MFQRPFIVFFISFSVAVLFYSSVSVAQSSTTSAGNTLPVFPGAEGFGVTTMAGRGGGLCKVTNTNATGAGSLRACIELSGPRIVIFETGGTIEVDEPLVINNPFISIFGQTAPGSGILVRASEDSKGSPMMIATHDVLIQHMRLRAGSSTQSTCCRDALRIGNSEPNNVFNVVIDHNSLSWGTDQIANTWYDVHDLTFSYNIISESLHDNGSNDEGPAGRGLLIGSDGAHSISIHHNVFAHSYQRNPLLVTSGVVDVVNNLVYHWVSRAGEQKSDNEGQKVNWVKNHFIAHTNGWFSKKDQPSAISWGDIKLTESKHSLKGSVYFEDNFGHHRKYGFEPQWKIAFTDSNRSYDPALGYHVEDRFDAPPVKEIPVNKLHKLLPKQVGALLPKRDSVDERVIQDVMKDTGLMPNCVSESDRGGDPRCQKNAGGWPTMEPGTARLDSDGDGMPDAWEMEKGFDPQTADSMIDSNNSGYLNIEEWVHSLTVQ